MHSGQLESKGGLQVPLLPCRESEASSFEKISPHGRPGLQVDVASELKALDSFVQIV